MSARKEWGVGSDDLVVGELRKQARHLGGDALVGVGFLQHNPTISGTVIRFKRDDCRQ